MFKIIEEETEVIFKDYSELSYINNGDCKEDGSPLIALYVNKQFEGDIEVWCDVENDERDYICVNYEMIYLDTIKEMF
jgi:hypothetical protein